MTDDACVCAKQAVCAELDICRVCVCVCVCNYVYGLIPIKPEDVCLTLIHSQRLLVVSGSTICVCMCAACISASVPMSRLWVEVHSARREQSLSSTKVTLLNLSGEGRGVK